MNNNISVNKYGVKTQPYEDTIAHACLYCDTWFVPTRRFIQKYCCESCRVLACRNRGLNGLGGNIRKRSTSNMEIKRSVETSISQLTDSTKRQIEFLKSEIRLELLETQKKIENRQMLHMLLTVVSPVVSPKVVNWITAKFIDGKVTEKDLTMEGIQSAIEKEFPTLPDNIKVMIYGGIANAFKVDPLA